ncbi:hypothetical protein T484DRAFT_1787687 [Baffinella frigidus]|nr:hypothetical protein T484DRAFT_1787687 [Cryptophyta sp. CCMP2293]
MDFLVCDGDSEAFYRVDNFSGGGGKKGRGRVHARACTRGGHYAFMAAVLTHMHADHLQGLTDEWDAGPLYASSQTMYPPPPESPAGQESPRRTKTM